MMENATAIDDMQGLYSHVSDAYRAGKETGRQDFYDAVIIAVQKISVEQEQQQGEIADRGFHVAQKCAGAILALKKQFDNCKVML